MVLVVAVALVAEGPRILMQRRPADREHGDLWEFPGGKVEPGESLESALLREIEEELGIALDPEALEPVFFASDARLSPARRQSHVILLYMCRSWTGEPTSLDATEIAWVAPHSMLELSMPPLDVPLAKALLRLI